MNDKFDELAKGLAQSVTRRGALKRFGLGLAGIALTALGVTLRAQAKEFSCGCGSLFYGCARHYPEAFSTCLYYCVDRCAEKANGHKRGI